MHRETVSTSIVAGVVIKRDGKYLLVQEKNPKVYGQWNFPAGKVDVGDTIEETAIKEAKEESGLEVELVRKLGIWQKDTNEPPQHAFEAKVIGGELDFPKGEILDARWFAFEEIQEMKNSLRGDWIIGATDLLENS